MSEYKQAPPGVETTPMGPHVSLREAAARLGKDPRTVIRAIKAGDLRGGAIPRPERLRWYVYADALPRAPVPSSPVTPSSSELDDLRAQLVTQREVNRLLIAAQQNMLAGESAAERYRAVAQNYLDALAQFVTPGHLGDLAGQM
ncbi:hypothetical protein MML61_27300 (plasmid) [Mycobacterium marinum]|uniref:hypothetical protein n=1 Tax=Mycobacterium marinum TaxID=1781 RepID=UPI00045FE2E5|nr:hypothetical protein [Mycobacterium marinum]WCS21214.1 hypothetical protein MML61_27300 [Mycobacterium marinum]WOR07572.1 hypothetical protein QDR78_27125 [Mycobacterium marinum]CDM79548.1 hypothetical protein MMARE11_p00450 [Mycobacterium marinum E11]BBC69159.1 hypothetical protein MMRN_p1280 [Mycobacterium marinum]GJO51300.1 hypothetical protein NJB1604_39300 [Mycobacterium marinum]